jgi:hypothetical protein
MLKRLGRQIIAIAQEADTYALQERKAFVSARLEQLEKKAWDL